MRKKNSVNRSLLCSLLVGVFCVNVLQAQEVVQSLNSDNNTVVWKVKAQAEVNENAEKICSESFNDNAWVSAIVPGTVFGSYVAAGLEKDPNFGDNIYKVDKQKYDRNFWYRTEITIPANFTKEKIWLNFNGINRKGDVFFNGQRIGFLDGFMQRGRFDVTHLVKKGGKNFVAVLVHWPQPNLANQCSPTYLSSGGWDWMPYVPGLNMGITDKVWLSNTGGLVIKESWIRTKLPSHARADVAVALEVANSSGKHLQGYIKGVIQPGNIEFSQKVSVWGNSTEEVKIDWRRFPQLSIDNPKLWWPNGYGQPNLYSCKLVLEVDGQISDTKSVQFGIKKYTYDTEGNVLHVSINGTRVFLKGGNWGMSEYMLRCRGEEYDTKIRLHKEMNFNVIRNWLGSTTDDEFYEACDKYGILVWDDFWINSNPNLPRDINTFNANVVEKIKRVRNHPCVAVWCGDNEGFPEPPLSNWMKENIRVFDGGERHFQPNSNTGNLSGSGVWGNKDPRYYFTAFPKASAGGDVGWGLRTETGTAVFTNFESFKKFMPQDKWWPRNDMWNIHYFGQYAFNATPDYYEQSLNERYGKAQGIEDFCRKAQLLNIETNKAMYEGWLDHMWDDASGIMTWMSQSAYPSLVWQTYDYYYDLTGAYWGVKKACEPMHIQWNPVTNSVKVVNTTSKDVSDLLAEVAVYNMDGTLAKLYSDSKVVESPANSAMHCFNIKFKPSQRNLSLNKPVYASSTEHGEPGNINDDNMNSRWASGSGDREWIYVDLGEDHVIAGVSFKWEEAYAKAFKIMVSGDGKNWKEVYSTNNGNGGEQQITFAEEKARYVKMQGVERATGWGYSLWDMKVFEGDIKSDDLSDVHFIKLKLTDKNGKAVSDNMYWRGHARKDFTALNNLPKVNLKVTSKVSRQNGKCFVNVKIQNPASSPAVAFATWVQVRNSKTNERILPAIMSDNYFTLLKGEEKEVVIEFDEKLFKKGEEPVVTVDTYNDHVINSAIEKKKIAGGATRETAPLLTLF